jgi:hypothetical protein
MMQGSNHDEEKVASVLRLRWRDWLPKLPRPIIAFGDKDLYLVLLEGRGFSIPVPGETPATGFFANAVVAASTIRDAERLAIEAIRRQWHRRRFARFSIDPTLRIDEITRLVDRFRARSRFGFAFFQE